MTSGLRPIRIRITAEIETYTDREDWPTWEVGLGRALERDMREEMALRRDESVLVLVEIEHR